MGSILRRVLAGAGAGFWVLLTAVASAQDIPKSADHPIVTRYQGSTIRAQTRSDFDSYAVPLGPAEASEKGFKKQQAVEGKVTKTLYQAPSGSAPLAVFRSYENALKQGGFEVLFRCNPQQCNQFGRLQATLGYSGKYMRELVGHSLADEQSHMLTARQPKTGAYVVVSTSHLYGDPSTVFFTVDVIEPKPLEGGLVTVDAEAMGRDITATGHVALYGIYFDTGKAVLKPESKAAIDEIAKLLKSQTSLKLHVVGHTDNVGTFAANLVLSKQRADAVVQALVTTQGIAAARLTPNGVASLAPIATNATEDGRAKNRRVELVAQ